MLPYRHTSALVALPKGKKLRGRERGTDGRGGGKGGDHSKEEVTNLGLSQSFLGLIFKEYNVLVIIRTLIFQEFKIAKNENQRRV